MKKIWLIPIALLLMGFSNLMPAATGGTPPSCGDVSYTKSGDFSDSLVSIDFQSYSGDYNRRVVISALNGWTITFVGIDSSGSDANEVTFGAQSSPFTYTAAHNVDIDHVTVTVHKDCAPTPQGYLEFVSNEWMNCGQEYNPNGTQSILLRFNTVIPAGDNFYYKPFYTLTGVSNGYSHSDSESGVPHGAGSYQSAPTFNAVPPGQYYWTITLYSATSGSGPWTTVADTLVTDTFTVPQCPVPHQYSARAVPYSACGEGNETPEDPYDNPNWPIHYGWWVDVYIMDFGVTIPGGYHGQFEGGQWGNVYALETHPAHTLDVSLPDGSVTTLPVEEIFELDRCQQTHQVVFQVKNNCEYWAWTILIDGTAAWSDQGFWSDPFALESHDYNAVVPMTPGESYDNPGPFTGTIYEPEECQQTHQVGWDTTNNCDGWSAFYTIDGGAPTTYASGSWSEPLELETVEVSAFDIPTNAGEPYSATHIPGSSVNEPTECYQVCSGSDPSFGEWGDWIVDEVNPEISYRVRTVTLYDHLYPDTVCGSYLDYDWGTASLYCVGGTEMWIPDADPVPPGAFSGHCPPVYPCQRVDYGETLEGISVQMYGGPSYYYRGFLVVCTGHIALDWGTGCQAAIGFPPENFVPGLWVCPAPSPGTGE